MASWTMCIPEPAELGEIDAALIAWEGTCGLGTGIQSGDLGWLLRNGPAELCAELFVWRSGAGEIAAVAVPEGDGIWLRVAPTLLLDRDLGDVIAADVEAKGWTEVACAGAPGAVRTALGYRNFAIDPAAWLHLWKPISAADRIPLDRVTSTATDDLIAERIAVQRSAFERSTFTREKWDAMAIGPSFRRELDLIALDDEGRGVSALTAWLPTPGMCAVIEPMGTHADHQRRGHGRRLLQATFSIVAELGASAIRVFAEPHNHAAQAAYQAAGLRIIGYDTTLVRKPS